ncbi:dihydrofolate reductase [Herbiconiux sp. P16]|uniref:dihydrofolate reductase n=1 Tax=Herbiconiux wuyangfengii TaxID=3342794 RepID=UPI0035BB1E40
MSVALIWAEARGGVIGLDGGIPWHLPEDLARFRELTSGGTVVMGRRTWESLPERFRPLPGRRNVVVTRQVGWQAPGADVVHSVDEALGGASGGTVGDATGRAPDDEAGEGGAGARQTVWVMGGGEIYRQALPLADRLEITEVDLEIDGDTRAPEIGDDWRRTIAPASGWLESRTGLRYRFATLTR